MKMVLYKQEREAIQMLQREVAAKTGDEEALMSAWEWRGGGLGIKYLEIIH